MFSFKATDFIVRVWQVYSQFLNLKNPSADYTNLKILLIIHQQKCYSDRLMLHCPFLLHKTSSSHAKFYCLKMSPALPGSFIYTSLANIASLTCCLKLASCITEVVTLFLCFQVITPVSISYALVLSNISTFSGRCSTLRFCS